MLFALIFGSWYVIWFSRRLKDVWLEGEYLVVSDYVSEERIPIVHVEEITETRLWNPKLIKLRFSRSSKWGEEIVFIAPLRFQFVFMNHPLVQELRTLVSSAKRDADTLRNQ